MPETSVALRAVRRLLAELAAEEAELGRDGEKLPLPPPLADGRALASVGRIADALGRPEGELDPADIAVARWTIEVVNELMRVRRGDPGRVELATLVEDLAREAVAELRPADTPEVAVARTIFAWFGEELDAAVTGGTVPAGGVRLGASAGGWSPRVGSLVGGAVRVLGQRPVVAASMVGAAVLYAASPAADVPQVRNVACDRSHATHHSEPESTSGRLIHMIKHAL
ncbi:hypothetical protein GCM10023321_50980 [Pseudonocardia eucalypti]|uniref:Uncharacterized protein n=1 Tax=Pseudonocardia eucalypti TaxID=648755 RepID=A0ABP9QKW7_9PSEU|nr:hypothetical protein [Pseudonocardia eucalypti]